MRVLVTGAAGYFGRSIIPGLLADPRIERVVGTDLLPVTGAPHAGHAAYHHEVLDLARACSADWVGLLRECDVVIHLAFQLAPRPGDDLRPVNVHGQKVFLEAALADPRRVIVASAAAVYGFAAGRDPWQGRLDEATPFAGGTGVAYAEHKQALEGLLDQLEPTSPATIVRARPTNVGGPGMPAMRAPLLTSAMMVVPATSHPLRQQLLHEADLASAFIHLLDAPAGAYNVGPDDWLTLEDAATLLGQGYLRLPRWVLRGLADVAWRAGRSVFDSSWLAFLEHPPIIIANDKLRALGWAPTYTTGQALMVMSPRARSA